MHPTHAAAWIRSCAKRLWPYVLVAVVAACGAAGPASGAEQTLVPPPPLSIVAILDRAPDRMAAELPKMAVVVQAGAAPSETLVVSLLASSPLADTVTVRSGDSLDAIARAHGLSLSALEDVNPQLGPVAGRSWNRIYPGDRVSIPGQQAPTAADPVVARAPAGPPPPALVPLPRLPQNATSFQVAQHQHALAAAEATNKQRAAAWRADVARALAPWQRQVVAQLQAVPASPAAGVPASDAQTDLGASVQAAVNTLSGLPGRRVLLLLGPGQSGPPDAPLATGYLAGIHLVVADLADPAAAMAWTAAGRRAQASMVTILDPALTQLQLAAVVNGAAPTE